jgi:hypothetical protein
MRPYSWTIPVVAGVFETGFSIGLKDSEGFTRLWPPGGDGDHDCAELGLGGGSDAESAARHGICSMDRHWRGGYSGTGHCAVCGVCGLEQAGLPGVHRYGSSRAEASWRIVPHSATVNLRTGY